MKQMKKVIAAVTLTGLMAAGLSMSAFAGDVAVLENQVVTKHFVMAEGLEVPDVTFSFTATAVTEGAPTASIENVFYSSTDGRGDLSNKIYTLDKDGGITFGDFPHAGVYEYTVKETAGDVEGITYDTTNYTMKVYVANDENGQLKVKEITADAGDGKEDSLSFTNTYRKDGRLEITKNTVGELADKTKDFEFTITFSKSGTENDDAEFYTGKIGNEDVECAIGKDTTFYLHDGESLVFEDLPVGTRYLVTEAGVEDGYVPSVSVIENSETTVDKTGTDAAELSTNNDGSKNLVGENENSVTFTNTYNDVPVTGILLKKLPFLMLIVLPGLALILPELAKFRMKKRGSH